MVAQQTRGGPTGAFRGTCKIFASLCTCSQVLDLIPSGSRFGPHALDDELPPSQHYRGVSHGFPPCDHRLGWLHALTELKADRNIIYIAYSQQQVRRRSGREAAPPVRRLPGVMLGAACALPVRLGGPVSVQLMCSGGCTLSWQFSARAAAVISALHLCSGRPRRDR